MNKIHAFPWMFIDVRVFPAALADALNIPGQISENINFLDLVQEFGTVFLEVSEYSLNINLKLLDISSFYVF